MSTPNPIPLLFSPATAGAFHTPSDVAATPAPRPGTPVVRSHEVDNAPHIAGHGQSDVPVSKEPRIASRDAFAAHALPAEMLVMLAGYLSPRGVLALASASQHMAESLGDGVRNAKFDLIAATCAEPEFDVHLLMVLLSKFQALMPAEARTSEALSALEDAELQELAASLARNGHLVKAARALMIVGAQVDADLRDCALRAGKNYPSLRQYAMVFRLMCYMRKLEAFGDADGFLILINWCLSYLEGEDRRRWLQPQFLGMSTMMEVQAKLVWNFVVAPPFQPRPMPEGWHVQQRIRDAVSGAAFSQAMIDYCPTNYQGNLGLCQTAMERVFHLGRQFAGGPAFLEKFMVEGLDRLVGHLRIHNLFQQWLVSQFIKRMDDCIESGRARVLHHLYRLTLRADPSGEHDALRIDIMNRIDAQSTPYPIDLDDLRADVIEGASMGIDLLQITAARCRLTPEQHFSFWRGFVEEDFHACETYRSAQQMLQILSEFPEEQQAALFGIPFWMFIAAYGHKEEPVDHSVLQAYFETLGRFSMKNFRTAVRVMSDILPDNVQHLVLWVHGMLDHILPPDDGGEWEAKRYLLRRAASKAESRHAKLQIEKFVATISRRARKLREADGRKLIADFREGLKAAHDKL